MADPRLIGAKGDVEAWCQAWRRAKNSSEKASWLWVEAERRGELAECRAGLMRLTILAQRRARLEVIAADHGPPRLLRKRDLGHLDKRDQRRLRSDA